MSEKSELIEKILSYFDFELARKALDEYRIIILDNGHTTIQTYKALTKRYNLTEYHCAHIISTELNLPFDLVYSNLRSEKEVKINKKGMPITYQKKLSPRYGAILKKELRKHLKHIRNSDIIKHDYSIEVLNVILGSDFNCFTTQNDLIQKLKECDVELLNTVLNNLIINSIPGDNIINSNLYSDQVDIFFDDFISSTDINMLYFIYQNLDVIAKNIDVIADIVQKNLKWLDDSLLLPVLSAFQKKTFYQKTIFLCFRHY